MKNTKLIAVCSIVAMLTAQSATAADKFWVASTTSNWNNSTSWSDISSGAPGATVPGPSDNVIFDAGGLGNCNFDINVVVPVLSVTSGYSGTINQGSFSLIVGNPGATFSVGIFSGGNANINIIGNLTIGGSAVFTSTSGLLEINGNYTNTTGAFNHNGGAVKFFFNNTISGTTVFNNVEFVADIKMTSGTELTAIGTITIGPAGFSRLNTGIIHAKGDITVLNTSTDSTSGGTAIIMIDGTGNQTLTGSGIPGAGKLPNVTINKPSGTLFLSGVITLGIGSSWEYLQGVIDATTFNSNIVFTRGNSIKGSHTLHNVEFFPLGASGYFIASGTELTLTGTLRMSGNPSSSGMVIEGEGIINTQGNILIENTGGPAIGGSATIKINGNENQTLQGSGIIGFGKLPNVVIDKPSGTLLLSSVISVGGNWEYIQGNVDAVSNNSTVVFTGVSFLPPFIIDGDGVAGAMKFNNVVFASAHFVTTITLGGNLDIFGTLTLEQFTRVKLNGNTIIIENGSPDAIIRFLNSGFISESTDNNSKIQWNIGNNIGEFVFPFITEEFVFPIFTERVIPLTLNITTPGTQSGKGNFTVTTYATGNDNLPFPSGVTNINDTNDVDQSLRTIDRFWQIEANNSTQQTLLLILHSHIKMVN